MSSHWQTKKLSEIGKIFNGNSINARVKKEKYLDLDDGLPFIATKDVDLETHSIAFDNGVKIPFDEKSFKVAHKNSVLICAEGGSAGKKVAFNEKDICFGNKLFAIETKENVYPKIVYYWYLTPMFFDAFKNQMNGIIGGVSIGNFKNLQIPLPTLFEQKRVVKILDKVFKEIETSKERSKKNLENSKELFESYLQSVFVPKGEKRKEEKTFGEVCKLIGGSQPPKDDFIYENKNGYIRLIQVRDYRTDKFITYIPKNKAKRFCTKDDIMIGRYGPPIFGIFRGLEGAYNVALMKAEINPKICISDYFFWFLKTNDLREFVESSSKRAAGQDGVRKEILANYPVPVPTLNEQQIIVNKLDALQYETKKLEAIYKQKLSNLEDLGKSILNKAFNGEL